jgi:uncharacterized protein (DUF433 family)
VIQGTRIPVSVILDQIANGDSWYDIVKGFPELKKKDIQAALLYASALLDKQHEKGLVESTRERRLGVEEN